MCLYPTVAVPLHYDVEKVYIPLRRIFMRILYLLDFISSEIVWIEKLHYFHEGIFFPKRGCHGKRIKQIPQLS